MHNKEVGSPCCKVERLVKVSPKKFRLLYKMHLPLKPLLALFCMMGINLETSAGPVNGSQCPEKCTCRKEVVKCMQVIHFPWKFPSNTKMITFDEMTVSEIPPNAFKGLNDLASIKFTRNNIGSISKCAFQSLPSLTSVKFSKCVIGAINPAAFSENGSKEKVSLTFKESQITTVKPYAFYNLKDMSSLSFSSTTIHDLQSHGFTKIRNVTELSFMSCDFRKVNTQAFDDVSGIVNQQILKSKFGEFSCHALDELILASKYSAASENLFHCDCKMNWLLDAKQSNKDNLLFLQEGVCSAPEENKGKKLMDVYTNMQKCKGQTKALSCMIPEPPALQDNTCPVRTHDDYLGDHGHAVHGRPRSSGPKALPCMGGIAALMLYSLQVLL